MHNKKARALSLARITACQAVYAINTKLLPKLLYTGQVAHYSSKRVQTWDARHREIVRRAADLPLGMPIDIFYLPTDKGGLGLRSVRGGIDIQRVNMMMEALNDERVVISRRDGQNYICTSSRKGPHSTFQQ